MKTIDRLSPESLRRVATLRAVRDLDPADPRYPPRVVRRMHGRLTVYLSLDDLADVASALANRAGGAA
jgi:hypothetical protein